MKGFFTSLFVAMVALIFTTLPAMAEAAHFPKVTSEVCQVDTTYVLTMKLDAWDGVSEAVDNQVTILADDEVIKIMTATIPSTVTVALTEAPTYVQVTAGEWDDGFTGGTSGGGIQWTEKCTTITAINEQAEPVGPTSGYFGIYEIVLTQGGRDIVEKNHNMKPWELTGCWWFIETAKIGDFYSFKCSVDDPLLNRGHVDQCYSPQGLEDTFGLATIYPDDQKSKELQVSFTEDWEGPEPLKFFCTVLGDGFANPASAYTLLIKADSNNSHIEKVVPVYQYWGLIFAAIIVSWR